MQHRLPLITSVGQGDILRVLDLRLAERARTLAINTKNRKLKEMLEAVGFFAEHDGGVRRDIDGRNALIGFQELLGSALAPMIVLDASARVRRTYDVMEQRRGIIVRLPSGPKDYSNLSVHPWARGGGRRTVMRDLDEIAEGIARTIRRCAPSSFLVICFKQHDEDELELRDLIMRRLGDNRIGRVEFCTWGLHTGRNDFANIENVILAGIMFLRPPQLRRS